MQKSPCKKIWIKGPFTNYAKHYAGVWCTLERANASSNRRRIVQINVVAGRHRSRAFSASVYSQVKAPNQTLCSTSCRLCLRCRCPATVHHSRVMYIYKMIANALTVQDFVQFFVFKVDATCTHARVGYTGSSICMISGVWQFVLDFTFTIAPRCN